MDTYFARSFTRLLSQCCLFITPAYNSSVALWRKVKYKWNLKRHFVQQAKNENSQIQQLLVWFFIFYFPLKGKNCDYYS